MITTRVDFIAELTFLTFQQGGRKKPVLRGYRPHIEFEGYPHIATSGMQDWKDREMIYPGETVFSNMTILAVDYFASKLYAGMRFRFCEGAHTVGNGIIIEVVNPDLLTL